MEADLDRLHRAIAILDRNSEDLGRASRAAALIDGVEIGPAAAARELVDSGALGDWIENTLDVGSAFDPPVTDLDVAAMRDARKRIAGRLLYVGHTLPAVDTLPPASEIVSAHRDLGQAEAVRQMINSGTLVGLKDSKKTTIEECETLVTGLRTLIADREAVVSTPPEWVPRAWASLDGLAENNALAEMEKLAPEAERLVAEARHFLTRPVFVPEDFDSDPRACAALTNLAAGTPAFGFMDKLTAGASRRRTEAIELHGAKPTTMIEWSEVVRYRDAKRDIKRLALRWNHGVREAGLDPVDEGNTSASAIAAQLNRLARLRECKRREKNLVGTLLHLMPRWNDITVGGPEEFRAAISQLELHIVRARLSAAESVRDRLYQLSKMAIGPVANGLDAVASRLGDGTQDDAIAATWRHIESEVVAVHSLTPDFAVTQRCASALAAAGAPIWARRLTTECVEGIEDNLTPGDWKKRWRLARLKTWLARIDRHDEFRTLESERRASEDHLSPVYEQIISKRAWSELAARATPKVRTSLANYANAMKRLGRGGGKLAGHWRKSAREAADGSKNALPCWIMPHNRVSESLPSELGLFDLVIVDEASQSTIAALPAVLRAKQILIVGDDKQVSPSFVGRPIERIKSLVVAHLGSQVKDFENTFREDESLYDLGNIVFASGQLMLKEHFRCAAPIIEYSRQQFYAGQLQPMRIPTASERLDPPLIDILVEDGFRQGDVNRPEVDCIVEEVWRLVQDPKFHDRTIGVTTLLGQKQAMVLLDALTAKLGYDVMDRHKIRVCDPAAFQGDERDIVFVSMVATQGNVALAGKTFEQRFNVAASRAKDRMILVRSLELSELSSKDTLRAGLIEQFARPFKSEGIQLEARRTRCESPYETAFFDLLTERGYRVDTQVKAGSFRIDLVVEGDGDRRLAIECDGDRYHGPDQWPDDMARQRQLERAGWRVWRCFASRFLREREAVICELLNVLAEMGIETQATGEDAVSAYSEHRRWRTSAETASVAPLAPNSIEPPAPEELLPDPRGGEPTDEPPLQVLVTVETIIDGRKNLSSEEGIEALRDYRKAVIDRDYPGHEPGRCILRDEIVKAMIGERLDGPDDFARAVPLFMRERIDGRQMRYLPDICEITALVSRDAATVGVQEPSQQRYQHDDSEHVSFGRRTVGPTPRPPKQSTLFEHVSIGSMPSENLVAAVVRIVENEGPIHRDEIARRLFESEGVSADAANMTPIMRALSLAKLKGLIRCNGVIWSTPSWRR